MMKNITASPVGDRTGQRTEDISEREKWIMTRKTQTFFHTAFFHSHEENLIPSIEATKCY